MLVLTPEVGIPFAEDVTPAALATYRKRAEAMVSSFHELALAVNLDTTTLVPEPEDIEAAREAFSKERLPSDMSAPAMLHLEALLSEYDKELVNVHVRLRAYITNKLLLETSNPDAKVRLKALELLGKLSDVGAFTDKVQIDVRNESPEALEDAILSKLKKYMDASVVAVQPQEAHRVPIDALDIEDIDAEVATDGSL